MWQWVQKIIFETEIGISLSFYDVTWKVTPWKYKEMTETSNKFNQMLIFASKNILCTCYHVTESALSFKRAFRFIIFIEILHGE